MELKVGNKSLLRKSFDANDVKLFASLSGDFNPLHLDEDFAAKTQFKKPIVHGLLVSSLFSAIIANELPGNGSIYLSQSLIFKAPVYHNQEVIASVEILSIRSDKPVFELKTICHDVNGVILIEGKALVLKK